MRNKCLSAVTVAQIQRLDRWATDRCGISSLVLMENAGRVVAEVVRACLPRAARGRVAVLCGTGNNGGDGFVAARHLANAGVDVAVYGLGRAQDLKPDAAANYTILKKCGCLVRPVTAKDRTIARAIGRADVIVDALFGVGLNRDIGEPYRRVIGAVNRFGKKVVAVDIPSGLDGTTGEIHGVCIQAFQTVTLSLPKKGFYRGQGPGVTGRVVVADIGIPRKLLSAILRPRK